MGLLTPTTSILINNIKSNYHKNMSRYDTGGVEKITCPYCYAQEFDSFEYNNEGTIECDCGETFDFSRVIDVTYNSYCGNSNHDFIVKENSKVARCSRCSAGKVVAE